MTEAPAEAVSTPSAPVRRDWRKSAKRIGWSLLRIYLIVAVVLYFIQSWMIFPGRSTQGQPQAQIRASTDGRYELIELTTRRGDKTHALFMPALDENRRNHSEAAQQPTIIFFYGNGMCLADCFGILQRFQRMGVNAMGVEYVGYGMSTGKPSEVTFYETADAAWEHLQSRTDIDPRKIVAAGWSLGGGTAVDLAHRKPVIGLATFSAFTSLPAMARSVLPVFPTSLLLRHRFDNLSKIREIDVPIFIAHGEHDSIIPSRMAKELSAAATSAPRVTAIVIDSDHNDLFDMDEVIYGPLEEFLNSLR